MPEQKTASTDQTKDMGDDITRGPSYHDGVVEEKKLHTGDIDPALAVTGGDIITFTPEEEKSVLSKIDWHILPLMCWIYAIQFADKISLNSASLMGIQEDTHLDPNSQQYSWVSSIFYAGYIFWE